MDPHQASTPHLLGLHTFQRWEAHYLTMALPHLQAPMNPRTACYRDGTPSAFSREGHLLPRPVTLALSACTHTHTHTHTHRFGPAKVPAACRAWLGAETHQKGQGSQPGSLHLRLLASAGRSQAAPLLCWPDLQDPGALGRAVLWQQQNTPTRSEGCSARSGLRVWSGDPKEAKGCSTPITSPRHASTRRSFLLWGCSPVFPKPPVLMGGRDVS